jgi:integrase
MALLLWTGVRRSDLVMLGKQHVRDGWLRFTQQKNRARKHSPDRDPDLARAAKGDRCNSNRQYDLFDDGHRQALHGPGLRQLVPPQVRRSRRVRPCPRLAQGWRGDGGGERRHHHAAHVIFGWLSVEEAERYTKAAQREMPWNC